MAKLRIPLSEMNQFDLPPVCVITGETSQVGFKPMTFSWYPRWVNLLAPCALLPAVILSAILTRRVNGELPFSEQGWADYRKGKLLFRLSFLGAFLSLFFVGPVLSILLGAGADTSSTLSLLMAVGLPVGIWLAFVRGRSVRVVEISKTHITLEMPSPEAVQRIEEHLYGGEAHPHVVRPASLALG